MFRDLFETVSRIPHETFIEKGRLIHKRHCLRCKLQEQIATLHEQVRLFVKTVDDRIGTYPSEARIDKLEPQGDFEEE